VLPDPVLPVAPAPPPTVLTPSACGAITSLSAGNYVCSSNVVFGPGAVTVNGQVNLYVVSSGTPPLSVNFSNATVNAGAADPGLFTVDVIGAGVIQPGDGAANRGYFTGVIDAPRSSLRGADCQFQLTGAAELGSFDCLTGASGPGPVLTYNAPDPSTVWHASPAQDDGGS